MDKKPNCRICFESDSSEKLLLNTCACRGNQIAIHKECLIKVSDSAMELGNPEALIMCGMCKQEYVGEACIVLAYNNYNKYKDDEDDSYNKMVTMNNLAGALCDNERYEESEQLYRKKYQ